MQIALMKYFQAKKPFENEQHIRRWLIRVTVNECKRYLVSPWRRYTAPLEDYAETLGFETPEQSALFFAVMELPQKYRVPIHLYYYEDYSVREISEMLGYTSPDYFSALFKNIVKMTPAEYKKQNNDAGKV